jgi:hypothetical protein
MIRIMVSKHTPGIKGNEPCFSPGDKARIDRPGHEDHDKLVTIRSYHVTHDDAPPGTLCHEYTFDDDRSQHIYCSDGKHFVPVLEK